MLHNFLWTSNQWPILPKAKKIVRTLSIGHDCHDLNACTTRPLRYCFMSFGTWANKTKFISPCTKAVKRLPIYSNPLNRYT